MKKIISGTVALMFLVACQQGNNGMGVNKADVGTVLGGVAGAWAGSSVGKGSGNTVAVAAGTLLGAALGRSIGQSMDQTDMMYYNQTSQQALETGRPGQSFPWQNPQTGVGGAVTPSTYFQNSSGQYCREYTQNISIGGRMEEGHGIACRQPDGSWRIQG